MDTKDILIVGALGIVGFIVYEKMKTPAVDPNALLESTFHNNIQTTATPTTNPLTQAVSGGLLSTVKGISPGQIAAIFG